MSKEEIIAELESIKTLCVMQQQYETASKTRSLIKRLEKDE